MKHFLWFPLALLLMPTSTPAQDADALVKKVETLSREGNHREAADLAKKTLFTPEGTAPLLKVAVDALASLSAGQEQEQVIEDAVKAHAKNWAMLLQAGQDYQRLPQYGTLIDGEYQRGQHNYRAGGRYVSTSLRDEVRALQLLEQAWLTLPNQADDKGKEEVLTALEHVLATGRYGVQPAWALQHLTDLSTLPGYDDESGLDSDGNGYPVDAEGNPIYFHAPASWREATSDGERLMFVRSALSQLGPQQALQARMKQAALAKQWFSVQTLAGYGFQPNADEEAGDRQNGIAALHTLKDDETTAKLATGPKRWTLPLEWSFIKLYQALAEDSEVPALERVIAWSELADEWQDRRQYPRAAEALKRAIALETRADYKKGLENRLDQILGHWGRFEPQEPQAAGKEAKLSLLFRNATKISLTARKVNVAKLLADTEAYLRSNPQDGDWRKSNVSGIGERLIQQEGEKYLGPITATWEQELKPRANHWDRRVEVATPLKEAGAWLVEGTFEGGRQTRALLWLESLVIVKTQQGTATHYFIADAVTGAPVPEATVRFFGYREEWSDRRNNQRPVRVYQFKDFQRRSDAQGQVIVKASDIPENHQWLITATAVEGKLAYLGAERFYFTGDDFDRDPFAEDTRLYTITDRPVYRPAQEVKWKAWARKVGYDSKFNTNAYRGAKIRVTITDPRGEKIHEQDYKADESGAIDDVLVLTEEATLGAYAISLEHVRLIGGNEHLGQHSFRVEEYKKPEFEVQVDAPSTPVALGDSFEAKVKADYYFGGPVKQGKVKYKVQRSAHTDRWFPIGPWDWLFGKGYGWRATYYSWYPGSERWCFCIPRYPWVRWNSDPPELVAEGESPLNADGTFTIKIDTTLAKELHGNEDHRYEIEAEVTDASRRTIFGKGSVLAARRPFEVYVSPNRGYYQAGEEGEIQVHARTLDGRDVKATGSLTIYRITYDAAGKPTEEAVHTAALSLPDPSGSGQKLRLSFPKGGQYRAAAKLKDEAGHEIEGVTFLTVRGQGFDEGKDFRFDDLELLVQKDEYAPGDEVEITVNTNRPGSTVALFLRPQNSVYQRPVWLKLEGKSTTYRFKLEEKDQPNIFIEAYTVAEARVHQVTRQILVPPSKRIASVELTPDSTTYLPGQGSKVKVKVRDQNGEPFTGKVVLTAYDKALEYISGGSNQEDIRPFFWGWKRSHYPQVTDSLHALETGLQKQGEAWMNTLGAFGGSVADESAGDPFASGAVMRAGSASGVTYTTMKMAPGAPAPAPMAEMAAPSPVAGVAAVAMEADAAGASEEGPQPMIRSNLADSAVWIADFTTDAQGEGEFHFNLPENLTTWKLRSWVMGSETQVGEASVEVITRKNLMVRLQAPRFFVEKDEVVISANVHNEMDVEQSVKAVLELEGGVLAFGAPASAGTEPPQGGAPSLALAPVTIPAHGEHRFDWRVKVTGEGEPKIRVKALAQKDSDAMEMTFPAYTHGILKTDAWSLAIRPTEASGTIKLRVPAERKPEQSRLEIRYSPTLAMALVDALPYLADYPYGCTEQTLNRFVPTVLTLGLLKDLKVNLKDIKDKRTNLNAQEIGKPEDRAKRWQNDPKKNAVFDEDAVKKMAKTGLARLQAMQNDDGGWGWFPGGRESSPHITAVVLHGLISAARTGLDINDGLVNEGMEWLKQHEAQELNRLRLDPKEKNHKAAPDNLDALIHSVLMGHKMGEKEMRDRLYENRAKLSRYNLALLGLSCDAAGETERRDMCLRNLKQFLKQDDENQTAYLDLPQGGWWWYWYEDQIETQAAFLRLLVAAEPKGELAPRIAKYLLNNRRNGTYWNSTKDTAAVIEALAAYVKASGESKPNQTVEILLDGKSLKKVEITRENLFTFDGTLVLEGDELTTGEHTLELRKLGESPLYANAYLTVFSQEDPIPAAGLEVKARRKFYKLIEEKQDQQVAGARGQVVTQQGLKYRREEIASDSPIKSGDLIEVELSIDSKNDYEYVLIEDLKPAGFEPIEVQSGWSYEGLTSYKEYRDEKVAFFAERLPRGTHNLSYRVKAEIPGRFSALPTKVEAMYAPELKGNAEEWKAKIVE